MGCPSVTPWWWGEQGQAAGPPPVTLGPSSGEASLPISGGKEGEMQSYPGVSQTYDKEKCHSAAKPTSEQKDKDQVLKGDPGTLGLGPAIPSFSAFWCIVDPKTTSYGLQRNRGARTQRLGRGLSSTARPV